MRHSQESNAISLPYGRIGEGGVDQGNVRGHFTPVIPQFIPECNDIDIEVQDESLHLAEIEVVASLNACHYNRCQSVDGSKHGM